MRIQVAPRDLRVGDMVILTEIWWAKVITVDSYGFRYEGDVFIDFDQLPPDALWIERAMSREEIARDIAKWL